MPKEMKLIKAGSGFRFEMAEKAQGKLPMNGARLRVVHAGVNFADVMMSLGAYPDAPKLPATPGYEIAGIVIEAGRKSAYKKGDRVAAFTHFGGYTDEVTLLDSQLVRLPRGLDMATAAAIPVNYATAALALHGMARVKKNDRVLIHGGGGGVGSLAVQIAKEAGAEVIATVGSDAKKRFVKSLGADNAVNYCKDEFDKNVLKITSGSGVDIILDPIGGKNLKRDFACLAQAGRVILFGITDTLKNGKADKLGLAKAFFRSLKFSPLLLMERNAGIYGLNMLEIFGSPAEDTISAYLDEGLKKAASGKLKVTIGGKYKLEEADKAVRDLLSRQMTGKLILECGEAE